MHIFGGQRPGAPGGGNKDKGSLPYVSERDFQDEVLLAELPVLVEFTSDRSQACQAIEPEVEAFAKEVAGSARS